MTTKTRSVLQADVGTALPNNTAGAVTVAHVRQALIDLSDSAHFPEDPTVKGDKGDKGDTGDQGLPGADGADGTNGIDGADGAPGTPGAPGSDAVLPPTVSQAEAEAGTSTETRMFTAERVAQAIAALAVGGGASATVAAVDPSSAPASAGTFWVNTATHKLWYSDGTATVSNWVLVFDEGGGTVLADITPALADNVPTFDASNGDNPGKATWATIISAFSLLKSDSTGETGSAAINNIVSLTDAQYTALTPTAGTLYLITDAT